MPAEIEWINEAAWRKSIVLALRQWETQAGTNAAKLAALAEREAKARAPVRTGKLRAGIEGRVDSDADAETVILMNEVEYAAFVEFGTRFTRAQPHMRPGFAAAVAAYERTMKEGME
jgi:HK97 gp10 family phage protein